MLLTAGEEWRSRTPNAIQKPVALAEAEFGLMGCQLDCVQF